MYQVDRQEASQISFQLMTTSLRQMPHILKRVRRTQFIQPSSYPLCLKVTILSHQESVIVKHFRQLVIREYYIQEAASLSNIINPLG
jgi:hypothetical protein